MIDMRLTNGVVNGPTSFQLLYKNWKDVKDYFPAGHVPKFEMANEKLFINTEDYISDAVQGSSHVLYLVMDKKGHIFNERAYGFIEIPSDGYVGRFTAPSTIGGVKRHCDDIGNDIFASIDYIVDPKEIHLVEFGDGQRTGYRFVSLDIMDGSLILPEEVREFARGNTEKFFRKYFEG